MNRCDWRVPMDHAVFAGHFPGRPILPGVLLLDRAVHWAQTQVASEMSAAAGPWVVSQAKFLSPVTPGETVSFVFTPDARGGWRFTVEGPQGRAVASGGLGRPTA